MGWNIQTEAEDVGGLRCVSAL